MLLNIMYLLEIEGRLNESRETWGNIYNVFMTRSISHFFQDNSTSSNPLYCIGAEKKIKDIQLDLASQTHHLCVSVLSKFGSIMRPSFLDLCWQSKMCRCGLSARIHFLTLSRFLQERTHCKLSSKCCPHQVWKYWYYCIPHIIVSPNVNRHILTRKSVIGDCNDFSFIDCHATLGFLITHSEYENW